MLGIFGNVIRNEAHCITLHILYLRDPPIGQIRRLIEYLWTGVSKLRVELPDTPFNSQSNFLEEVSIPWLEPVSRLIAGSDCSHRHGEQASHFKSDPWEGFIHTDWDKQDLEPFLDLLQYFSKTLGSLICTLSGRIPPIPGLTASMLGSSLSQFPKLETVHVSRELVEMSGCGSMEECASQLVQAATQRSTLRNVIFVLSVSRGVSIRTEWNSDSKTPRILDRSSVQIDRKWLRVIRS